MADGTCTIDGCEKPVQVKSRGWCSMHYARWSRHGSPNGGRARPDPRAEFDRLLAIETDDCVLWPHARSDTGYPNAQIEPGRTVNLHREALMRHTGEDPKGMHAAHWCGVRPCINVRHLRWATPKENVSDKQRHGTHRRGESNPRVVLTEAKVLDIIARCDAGESQRLIGRAHGVPQQTVSDINRGRSWSWLTGRG